MTRFLVARSTAASARERNLWARPLDEGRGVAGDDKANTKMNMAEQPPPDPVALRRRVLLTGMLTMMLFLAAAYVVASTGISDAWLLLAVVLIYLLVVRPLMQPVRDASRLRRSLAYQAFLDSKDREQ